MSAPETDPPLAAASRRGAVLLRPWLPATIGALCFVNSLANNFTYDDKYIVQDNPRVRSLTDFRAVWLSDWWKPHGRQALIPNPNRDRLYRPLTLFTFAINYAVDGLRPLGYHLVNVALHALVCILVWHLAQRLFNDAAISTCAALLFAVHPVHCEAVADVVGRAEVLSALFLLVGLLVLLPKTGVPGLARALFAAATFFAGLLAKETAVCYPALAVVAMHAVMRVRARLTRRWWLMHAAVLLMPLAVYLPVRYVALERHLLRTKLTRGLFNPLHDADLGERAVGVFTILGHYTRLTIAPSRLSCDYGLAIVDPRAGPDAMTVLGIAAAATGVVLLFGYRSEASSTWRKLAVLTALTAASYALISNTVLLIGVSLAERLLYWPSVPIVILLAVVVMNVWREACAPGRALHGVANLLRVCGVLLLAALALRSVVRNADWTNNERLFLTDVRTEPQGAHLNQAAARTLINRAERATDDTVRARILGAAEEHLIRALRIHPRFPDALQDRARARAMLGDTGAAVTYLESALLLDPHDMLSKQWLARLRGNAEPKIERLESLLSEIEQRPDDAELRVEAGRLLIELGRQHDALVHLERAVELAPNDPVALRLLGQALVLHHEDKRAVEVFRRVLSANPDDWEAHTNLSAVLADLDPPAALVHAQEAYRLRPNDVRSNVNLAEALANTGRFGEALQCYRRILRDFRLAAPFQSAVEERVAELQQQQH